MKKLFVYLKTFFKTLFRQLFNSSEIKKVEEENIISKAIKDSKITKQEHKDGKKFNPRFFRRPISVRIGRPCLECGGDMKVSIGQLAYFHRACRQKGRNESKYARYARN